MKFGVREICDVVLKAKANQKIGNKIFYKDEPVLYFDTLKTSSLEGTAETVYATGGRGNTRLAAWEGERTVTFTMEDALISPIGFSILSGAGLIDAKDEPVYQHMIENIDIARDVDLKTGNITLSADPYDSEQDHVEDFIYVMILDEYGEVDSEPYIATRTDKNTIKVTARARKGDDLDDYANDDFLTKIAGKSALLVDYYVKHTSNAQQIEITADKFGGTFYLEASTLFCDANTGMDLPAEFIIPKCKIQSNFTFTMASTGDPSTFTFTMDAFPDYTRFNKTKKVLAAIQLFSDVAGGDVLEREATPTERDEDANGTIVLKEEDENA